jgi:hypothetical protein
VLLVEDLKRPDLRGATSLRRVGQERATVVWVAPSLCEAALLELGKCARQS